MTLYQFFLELAKIYLDGTEINNIYLKDYNEAQERKARRLLECYVHIIYPVLRSTMKV